MRSFRLLDEVPEPERRLILQHAVRRRFGRGEVVFHHGDPGDSLHLVMKGRLAVEVTTRLGDTAMLALVGPGDFFGELALVSDTDRRAATCRALEPAETWAIQRGALDRIRADHPAVDRFLVLILAERTRRLNDRLVEALYHPVPMRVHRRLVELAEIYAEDDGPASIRLTQDHLAALCGTSRPTVNQILRDAERDGLIALARGRVDVVDRERLRRSAGSTPRGRTVSASP